MAHSPWSDKESDMTERKQRGWYATAEREASSFIKGAFMLMPGEQVQTHRHAAVPQLLCPAGLRL